MATATSSSHTVCVYYCSTYYKAVRVGGGGETMEDMSPHLQGQPRQQREHAGRQRQRHLRRRPPAGRRRAFFLHRPWQWTATPSSADYGDARCVCVCVCVTVCVCIDAQCNNAGNGAYQLNLQLFTTCIEHHPPRTNAVLKIPSLTTEQFFHTFTLTRLVTHKRMLSLP